MELCSVTGCGTNIYIVQKPVVNLKTKCTQMRVEQTFLKAEFDRFGLLPKEMPHLCLVLPVVFELPAKFGAG